MQPPWWDSETRKAWTEKKRVAVRNWRKGRTRPNPDPKLKSAMDTKTEQFTDIALGAKEANICGTASVRNPVLKQR